QSKPGQSHLLPESLLLELRRKWQGLSGSTDTFDQHTELLGMVQSALKLLGKNSQQLLENDLPSLFLARLSVEELPQLVEQGGRLRGLGAQWLSGKESPEL
ncbi:chemotaxis protein, partial [Micrococcus endophyticus]